MTGLALHEQAGRGAVSRGVYVLLGLVVALSFFVMKEPAPCDVLFVPALIVAWWSGVPLLPRIGFALYTTLHVFVFASLLSLMFVTDIAEGVRFLSITLYMLAAFFVFAGLVERDGERATDFLFRMLCVAALIAALIGLAARFGLIPHADVFFRGGEGLRIKSTFKDPNVFAPFLVAGLIVALNRLLEAEVFAWRNVGLILVFGAGILFAFSRGAYAHLVVSFVTFVGLHLFVVRRAETVRRLVAALVVLAVFVIPLLLYALFATDLVTFLSSRFGLKDYDSYERFATQAIAVRVAMETPLGIGPGMFNDTNFPAAVHSLYLRVVCENGWLAFVALLGFAGVWLHGAFASALERGKHAGIHACCLAIVAGILVESAVLDTLHWRHFFLVLAVSAGLRAHERRHEVEGFTGAESAKLAHRSA